MNIYSELFIDTLNNNFDWINPILNIPIQKNNLNEKTDFEDKLQNLNGNLLNKNNFIKTFNAIKNKNLNNKKIIKKN